MVTLSKRATPSQRLMLKIIEGAVLNTADAHSQKRDSGLARSIAKRAAGTLSSQWMEVLAANTRPSVKGPVEISNCRACERRAYLLELEARKEFGAQLVQRRLRGKAPEPNRRFPLLILWERLSREMWEIRRGPDKAKFEAYPHLLKMIHQLHKEMTET